MEMSTFWSTVVTRLSFKQVKQRFPAAIAAATHDNIDVDHAEFAEDVIPNIGPGGPTTDEDEADLAERDPRPGDHRR